MIICRNKNVAFFQFQYLNTSKNQTLHQSRTKNVSCEPCFFLPLKATTDSPFTHSLSTNPDAISVRNINTQQGGIISDAMLNFHSAALEAKQLLLVQRIKEVIIDSIYSSKEEYEFNFSKLLSERLNYDYVYLANLFSRNQGLTIEKFRIVQKVERVKKFLLLNELTITRIALNMHYSSVGHLSNQFKKTTGISPTDFRKQTLAPYAGNHKPLEL